MRDYRIILFLKLDHDLIKRSYVRYGASIEVVILMSPFYTCWNSLAPPSKLSFCLGLLISWHITMINRILLLIP